MGEKQTCKCGTFLYGLIAGVVLIGVLASVMGATDARPFCASCHAMQTAAVTHKMSTHADKACNECHVPHSLTSKVFFKAQAGLADFTANMSGGDLPLQASASTRKQVNDNCKRCHANTNMNVAVMDTKAYCVDCHNNVAHMRKMPISTRMVAYE